MRRGATAWAAVLLLPLSVGVSAVQGAELRVKVVDSEGHPVDRGAVLVSVGGAPLPAPPTKIGIRQRNLRFEPSLSVVQVGTSVQFTNEDEFDHHVRGSGSGSEFEFMIPARDSTADRSKRSTGRKPAIVVLRHPGIVRLSCHLHGSMRGHILVADTPHHGLTDSGGKVSFTDLPDGAAAISAWHPLMLTRASATIVRLSEDPSEVTVRLNFVLPGARR